MADPKHQGLHWIGNVPFQRRPVLTISSLPVRRDLFQAVFQGIATGLVKGHLKLSRCREREPRRHRTNSLRQLEFRRRVMQRELGRSAKGPREWVLTGTHTAEGTSRETTTLDSNERHKSSQSPECTMSQLPGHWAQHPEALALIVEDN